MSDNIQYAPVIVFAYKRKSHLERCLVSLSECEGAKYTEVIVFSDGNKNEKDLDDVTDVRICLEKWKDSGKFKNFEIVKREKNYGLAKSVISGVTEAFSEYERIIVVEDDLILAKDFLRYMSDGLKYYKDRKNYGSISAYTYDLKGLKKYKKDIYVLRKGDCWGWATWKDRWQNVDWELKDFETYLADKSRRKDFSYLEVGLEDQLIAQVEGRLDAWAARWIFHLFNNELVTVYPRVCRAVNIGLDGSGVNCSNYDISNKVLYSDKNVCHFEDLEVNKSLEKEVSRLGKRKTWDILMDILHILRLRLTKK